MRLAPGPMGSELWPPGEDATGYTFFPPPPGMAHLLCPIGNGLFQPDILLISVWLSLLQRE